jgi:hypothetical protein
MTLECRFWESKSLRSILMLPLLISPSHMQLVLKITLNYKSPVHNMFRPIWSSSDASKLMLETSALTSTNTIPNFALFYAPMFCTNGRCYHSCTRYIKRITQQCKRTANGRIKGGNMWNCIHWRKCSGSSYQIRSAWWWSYRSKHVVQQWLKIQKWI